jgi:hypothetical protein
MDTAIQRSGGFGVYQGIVFITIAIFKVFGDQIIFNFVYLTRRHLMQCQYPGEDGWKACTKEEVC